MHVLPVSYSDACYPIRFSRSEESPMAEHSRPPRLRVVPDPEHPHPPPQPHRDPWWLHGWYDYSRGIPRPAGFADPGVAAHLVDGTGAFVADLETARAVIDTYNDGWHTTAAEDPSQARHPGHPRPPHGAVVRLADHRRAEKSALPASSIALADTGRTDLGGDAVLDVDGAIRGTIAVGYRLHHTAAGPIWYLRIQLAPQVGDAFGALRPTRITIDDVELLGGVVLQPVDPAPLDRPEDCNPATADTYAKDAPTLHQPMLTPLALAVLEHWHSPDRLRQRQYCGRGSSSPPSTNPKGVDT